MIVLLSVCSLSERSELGRTCERVSAYACRKTSRGGTGMLSRIRVCSAGGVVLLKWSRMMYLDDFFHISLERSSCSP